MIDETSRARGWTRLAPAAVRLAAAWILVGACFKLFLGTPADLPAVVRGLSLDDVLTYKLAIAIELATVVLACLRPGLGFWPVLGAYLVFEGILGSQLAAGAESCGCFGSKVKLTPVQMMAIDSTLLALMLLARPWRLGRGGAPWWLVLLLAAGGVALPFALNRQVGAPPVPADGGAAASAKLGAKVGRGYVVLNVEEWVGQPIDATPLAKCIEGGIEQLPFEGVWILWRMTCDHCARHFEHLAQTPPDAPFITLVRLKEKQDTEANRQVTVLPEGDNVIQAQCPDTIDYLVQTPAELWLEGGVIVRAEEGVGDE